MPNPIAARWESSKLQLHPKTLHPLLTLPPPTKPQLSVPTPPGQTPRRWRVRGQSKKKKTLSRNVPTHKHGVRPGPPLSSTVILYKMFWARLCSPGPTQTTEFLIFLCVHPPPLPPPPLRPPPPAAEPLGMFCANTAMQGSDGGPLHKAWWAWLRGPLAPVSPQGPHQHRPTSVVPPEAGGGHVVPVQSCPLWWMGEHFAPRSNFPYDPCFFWKVHNYIAYSTYTNVFSTESSIIYTKWVFDIAVSQSDRGHAGSTCCMHSWCGADSRASKSAV